MRRLERWLHQHIFKVGWLATHNLRTTTVLYYVFFLPGVFLHELMVWLVAGILNVRADRAIAWPEAQAIAELKLNFIKLGKDTSRIRLAIIGLAPLVGGLVVIWLITTSVLNLDLVIGLLRAGSWDAIGSAVNVLLLTPDVWLWVYLMFTVANTMMPERGSLQGWRPYVIGLSVLLALLYLVGVGQQVFLENLAQPISDSLSRLALIFLVIIVIDLIVTGVLGLLEAVIERLTKNSATFQNGKLVAVTREEMLRQRQARQQARAKTQRPRTKAAAAQAQTARGAVPAAGPPSFYRLSLPIPAAPGKEAEPITVRRDDRSILPPGELVRTPASVIPIVPDVIAGSAVVKTEDDLKPEPPLQEAKLDLPAFALPDAPAPSVPAVPTDAEKPDEEDSLPFDALDDFADAINPQPEAGDGQG